MDTKQLITGNPKEGFYPIVQDTVTVIELNEAVMNLTSESSSEDIAAAFDTVEGFNELIENVRNSENIVNGILVNNDGAIGKIICTIYAYKNQYACNIEYIYNSKIIRLDITNTDGTLSCVRKEININSQDSSDIFYIDINDTIGDVYNSEKYIALSNAMEARKTIIMYDSLSPMARTWIATNYYIGDLSELNIVFVDYDNTSKPSIYIRRFYGGMDNYKVETKTFNLNLITNGDGSKFLSDDGTYKTIEAGDKTNVLILSLENDLANGQKDSPVTAEVSTALKDAISTGKACVIKSANSDILANLQQTGNNVTIIMEQISRVGQTFVAVNTTITVNTATNVISDYQTGAIVLETEGDGSKFLSDDGKYKTIDNKPVIINYDDIIEDENHINNIIKTVTDAYKNNKPILLNDTGTLMPLTSYEYISNILSISFIKTSLGTTRVYSFEINGNDYLIAKNVQVELANYKDFLTKDNASPFTPTGDYNPATKKYVDDSKEIAIYENIDALNADKENLETKIVNGEVKAVMIKKITFENNTYIAYVIFLVSSVISDGMVITLTSSAFISISDVIKQYQLTSNYHANYILSEVDYYTKLNILHKDNDEDKITGNFTDINNLINWNKVVIADDIYSLDYTYPLRYSYDDPSGTSTLIGWDIIKGNLLKLDFKVSDKSCTQTKYKMPRYEVVTESEYSALGETPNTDNVLYFVTPD